MTDPYRTPESTDLVTDTEPPAAKKRRHVLVTALVSALAIGCGEAWFENLPDQYSLWNALTTVLMIVLALAWVHYDARLRGYRVGGGLRIAILLLAALAIPYYLFRSRGFRPGLAALGLMALLCLAFVALFAAGYLPAAYLLGTWEP